MVCLLLFLVNAMPNKFRWSHRFGSNQLFLQYFNIPNVTYLFCYRPNILSNLGIGNCMSYVLFSPLQTKTKIIAKALMTHRHRHSNIDSQKSQSECDEIWRGLNIDGGFLFNRFKGYFNREYDDKIEWKFSMVKHKTLQIYWYV